MTDNETESDEKEREEEEKQILPMTCDVMRKRSAEKKTRKPRVESGVT